MGTEQNADYVVVGGGIAGVSCAEMLSLLAPGSRTLLVSPDSLVKSITDVSQMTKLLTSFSVVEEDASTWQQAHAGVTVVRDALKSLSVEENILNLASGDRIHYEKICLCTGAEPRIIADNPYVIGIRDTASVGDLQTRLSKASRVLVVGNGGIATELVYELEKIDVVWAVKDDAISSVFLDPGAAQFLMTELKKEKSPGEPVVKRHKYSVTEGGVAGGGGAQHLGSALGPDWHKGFSKKGTSGCKNIHIKYEAEVAEILTRSEWVQRGEAPTPLQAQGLEEKPEYPVYVRFTDGSCVGADFVVSATGVRPNSRPFRDILELADDEGIKVDEHMLTSHKDVYAAGDVCTATWTPSHHWMQMRLWTQARQMGMYAAKCMQYHATNQEPELDFCFELFTHVTSFFGHKVVLLGLYKGQKLDNDYEVLVRVTPGKEFVKAVMKEGRMQGAVLIGDTDLEETFENLILNQMDLSELGADLLDPGVDIEDYFD